MKLANLCFWLLFILGTFIMFVGTLVSDEAMTIRGMLWLILAGILQVGIRLERIEKGHKE